MIIRFVAALLALAWLAPAAGAQAPERGLAIVGADVLTMTGKGRLREQIILVEGDRIVRVAPIGRAKVPAGYRRIEAKGMTLMPGLVDMHIHLAPAPGQAGDAAQRALAVMLAHGVTTARTMAGNPVHLGVREGLAMGRIVGPRLYAAAPAIHQGNAKTPDEARAAVAAAASAGFDLIKSHQIADVAVWQAVQDEAARRRIPVAGHVANEIGLGRALAAGQQIEHLDAMLFELLPVGAPERAIPFAQIPPPPVIDAVARATDAKIGALVRKVAAAGRAFQVPTLSLFELVADTSRSAAELRARPEMRYIPAAAIDAWAAQRAEMAGMGFTADHAARFREIRRRLVRALHRAGVPLMAGSDTAQAFHIWGPGLIEEVEALGAAGLPPADALRAATVVPRDYFRSLPNGGSAKGRADFGTVEPGARADLILLAKDPSRNLSALRSLRAVIAGGRLHDRAALDAMLDRAAADAKAAPPPPAPAM